MGHSTGIRKAASAVGAAAIIAIVGTAPASARPDPGEPTTGTGTSTSTRQEYRNNIRMPFDDRADQQPAASDDSTSGTTPGRGLAATALSGDGDQYLQLGFGAIGVVLVAGAAATVINRRHHHHATTH